LKCNREVAQTSVCDLIPRTINPFSELIPED
jgi:hypothetical protein